MTGWNFLTNHGLVLIYIGRHPESTGLEIAQAAGITERATRKILDDLQAVGYIERQKLGRRNRYQVNTALPLPYRGNRDVTVGELLSLLWRAEDTPFTTASGGIDVQREGVQVAHDDHAVGP